MKRISINDAQMRLEPVTIRLWPSVIKEARCRGEHVRGGTSAVIRNLIAQGMRSDKTFSRAMYDALISDNKTKK